MPGAGWKPDRHREPVVADPRHAGRDDRAAVLPAVDDEPARAGVVRAALSGTQPVSAVRAVESRVDARAARLSVPARAVGRDARAGVGLVGRLRAVRRCCASRRPSPACAPRSPPAANATAGDRGRAVDDARRRRFARQALWCALAATGSLLLLAVSNHITQNIAAVPLLWIVPLDAVPADVHPVVRRHRLVQARASFLSMGAAALGVMAWTLADPRLTHELEIQLGVFCVGLFLACMFCHGELARLQARAALPDALLPDDLARRRARRSARRASSRRSRCLRTSSSRSGLALARCCCCGRSAATAPVFAMLGRRVD